MHYDKIAMPQESILLAGSKLKWYDLFKEGEPVTAKIRSLAASFLQNQDAAGGISEYGEMGFVILHRCGLEFYFLLVSTWRNGNELWESVYAKPSSAENEFSKFELSGTHRATFCVWELAIVWHEQQAWKRFLLSDQSEAAKTAYLLETYRGTA
jgi:hypothetical protein